MNNDPKATRIRRFLRLLAKSYREQGEDEQEELISRILAVIKDADYVEAHIRLLEEVQYSAYK